MRIIITSDLHYEDGVFGASDIKEFFRDVVNPRKPDLFLVAGDVSNQRLAMFSECCAMIAANVDCPWGLVAGNHDVWHCSPSDPDSYAKFFGGVLKAHTERWGGIWLDDTSIRCGNLAVMGSLAWYDYTADPNYQRGRDNYYWNLKKKVSNDAECIDWKYNDIQVSNMLRASLDNRMTRLSQIAGVEQIMVITHVPVFARQMPYGSHVDDARAFYGSYKTGDMLGRFPKLRYVVSGHTHRGAEDTVAGINMRVVDSHYGAPAIERIDVQTGSPYIRTLAI